MTTDRLFTHSGERYVLHLGKEERALLAQLLGELRELLEDPAIDGSGSSMVRRLFPVVHPDHPEREAEYQRLMREELVTSRLAAIDDVDAVLKRGGRKVTLDEAEMSSLVQAVNSVRLVLGTMLDVSEDENDDGVRPELAASPEYHLYAYLSWLLDSAVRVLSGDL